MTLFSALPLHWPTSVVLRPFLGSIFRTEEFEYISKGSGGSLKGYQSKPGYFLHISLGQINLNAYDRSAGYSLKGHPKQT